MTVSYLSFRVSYSANRDCVIVLKPRREAYQAVCVDAATRRTIPIPPARLQRSPATGLGRGRHRQDRQLSPGLRRRRPRDGRIGRPQPPVIQSIAVAPASVARTFARPFYGFQESRMVSARRIPKWPLIFGGTSRLSCGMRAAIALRLSSNSARAIASPMHRCAP